MSTAFEIAYREYLRTARETTWSKATAAARAYAALADPSADWRADSNLNRRMARIAYEEKPGYMRRNAPPRSAESVTTPVPAGRAHVTGDDFFAPRVERLSDTYARALEGLAVGSYRVVVFGSYEDNMRFQQRMNEVAARLGWRKPGDDEKSYTCETLKSADAYYINGSVEKVSVLRVVRLR